MITLINKDFNGKQYTLVDHYGDIVENELIYYFISDDDDFFCFKINDRYVIINDEQMINLIKNKYELFQPEIIFYIEHKILARLAALGMFKIHEKLNEEEREKFFDIHIKKLKELGEIIDFAELKNRLMKEGAIYLCDSINPFYHLGSKSLFIHENKASYTNLHETIHKATAIGVFDFSFPSFFTEGGAESICEKLKGKKQSNFINLRNKDGQIIRARYNFSLNSLYYVETSLLRQIEHAVGYSADVDVLNGTKKILNDFGKKYGRDTLRYISYVGNRATRNAVSERCGKVFDPGKGLYEKVIKAQNLILERVYNKDFPKKLTLENAQEYMNRLKQMEQYRGHIPGDDFYKKFYEEKYNIIKQKLLEKGYGLPEIESKIYEYIPMEFYPTEEENLLSESSIQQLAEKCAIEPEDFAKKCRWENEMVITEDKLKRYALKTENIFMEVFTYDEKIWQGKTFVPKIKRNLPLPGIKKNTSEAKEEKEDNIVYFDSESNTLKYTQNGQVYDLEEVPIQDGFVDKVNFRLKQIQELQQNANTQKGTEIKTTKRNLFERIRNWLNIKNKENRGQEVEQNFAEDQRENI